MTIYGKIVPRGQGFYVEHTLPTDLKVGDVVEIKSQITHISDDEDERLWHNPILRIATKVKVRRGTWTMEQMRHFSEEDDET